MNLSSFIGSSSDPSVPPPRATNIMESKVTVPDSSTVLLGGLNQANNTNTVTGVPFLSEIPLIGKLFTRTTDSKQQSTPYLFVKSRIARAEDFSDLKGESSEASQQLLQQENAANPRQKVPTNQDVYESPAFKAQEPQ